MTSALDLLVLQIQPIQPLVAATPVAATVLAVTDTGSATSTPPKRLALIRELVAKVAAGEDGVGTRVDADTRTAATLLGWLQWRDGEGAILTDAGLRLLGAAAGSRDESAAFAAAILENPPLCRIAGAVLLGEWLGLHDLAPALARELGLHSAQASRLVPCVLAWRDELRPRGWTPREAALHLRSRTAWMTGLSGRARDVLARLGVFTREHVLATESGSLRDAPGCRLEMVREIERFRAQLGTGAVAASPVAAVDDVPAPSSMVRRKRRAAEVGPVMDDDREATSVRESVQATARRVVERRGCVSIGAMARELPGPELALDQLRGILVADAGVRWLDDDRAWFWIPDVSRNRLLERLDEVRGQAGEIAVAELRAALMRDPTIAGDVPPAAVFAALCEQLPTTAGTRARKVRRRDRDAVLSSVEPVVVGLADERTPTARPTIGGDSSVAELARAAGITMQRLVALALGDVGREKAGGARRPLGGGGRTRR